MAVSVAVVEIRGIARGIAACDRALKTARVSLFRAAPACPGKYLLMLGGQVAACRAAWESAKEAAGDQLVDDLFLANLNEQVLPALVRTTEADMLDGLGVLETDDAASALMLADAVAKNAAVDLLSIRLASGLAGRGTVCFTGTAGALQAGGEVARRAADNGLALRRVALLLAPDDRIWRSVL